jgi:hypothetical protein
MKYRDLEYSVTPEETAWIWSLRQGERITQSGRVNGPKWWAVKTAKVAIDEIADAEVRRIEARLQHLNVCLDAIKLLHEDRLSGCN